MIPMLKPYPSETNPILQTAYRYLTNTHIYAGNGVYNDNVFRKCPTGSDES